MKRIVIKLSGEGLSNKGKSLGIDPKIVSNIVFQIKKILKEKIQIGIVIGGGNFWRGASAIKNGISRNRADYIGMLATIMNGLALQSEFEKQNVKTIVQSAIAIDAKVAQNYINEKAISALEKGKVVIFVGGVGRPFFTTDTAAALVASEIYADEIIMGKNGVEGVYDSDPRMNPNSKKIDSITYDELIKKEFKVMDVTAVTIAKNNNIKLIVFDITKQDALVKIVKKEIEHTEVIQ